MNHRLTGGSIKFNPTLKTTPRFTQIIKDDFNIAGNRPSREIHLSVTYAEMQDQSGLAQRC